MHIAPRLLVFGTAVLFCGVSGMAQNQKEAAPSIAARATAAVSEMKKLDFLVGNWKGKGTAFFQNKQFPSNVDSSFQQKLNGKVMIVEFNDHLAFLPKEAQGGLLAISFDGDVKKYQVQFCLGDGRWIDSWGALDGQSFTWGYGDLRTTFKVSGAAMNVLSEVGFDQKWRKVVEHNLTRGK